MSHNVTKSPDSASRVTVLVPRRHSVAYVSHGDGMVTVHVGPLLFATPADVEDFRQRHEQAAQSARVA